MDEKSKKFEQKNIAKLQEERVKIQKKTFTKWMNCHLKRASMEVSDIFVDLADGKVLQKLMEVIYDAKLSKPNRGVLRDRSIENVNEYIQSKVVLQNSDDGKKRLFLNLIWSIILHFQIQEMVFKSGKKKTAKYAILKWCKSKTRGYKNVNINDFSKSWRDGMAFNALIHAHFPELINFDQINPEQHQENLSEAFSIVEKEIGVPTLLDPEDVDVEEPDEKSILTYVSSLYLKFTKTCVFGHVSQIRPQQISTSTEENTDPRMRPYPNSVDAQVYDNKEVVFGISLSCHGRFVATIGYSKVKIWTTDTMLLKRSYTLMNDDGEYKNLRNPSVAWNPVNHLLAIASGNTVKIIDPCLNADEYIDKRAWDLYKQSMKALEEEEDEEPTSKKAKTDTAYKKDKYSLLPAVAKPRMEKQSSGLELVLDAPVLDMSWYVHGNLLHTIAGRSRYNGGVLRLHDLCKFRTIWPIKGDPSYRLARFCPMKPLSMYLANNMRDTIDLYDFYERKDVGRLRVPERASAMAVHSSGELVAVGTFEGKLYCFDVGEGHNTDIAPFVTIPVNYYKITSIAFHKRHPLMACTTSDGSVAVFYVEVDHSPDKNHDVRCIKVFDVLDTKRNMHASVFHTEDATLMCGGEDGSIRYIRSSH